MCDSCMLHAHFQQVRSRRSNDTAPHLPLQTHPAQMHQQCHLPVVLVVDKLLKKAKQFVSTDSKVGLASNMLSKDIRKSLQQRSASKLPVVQKHCIILSQQSACQTLRKILNKTSPTS